MIKRLIPLVFALVIGFAVGIGVAGPAKPLKGSQTDAPPASKTTAKQARTGISAEDQANRIQLQPLMDNIFTSLQNGDYKFYTRDFVPEVVSMNTKENFDEMRSQAKATFGKLKKPVFIGSYKKGDNVTAIWKSATEKANGDAVYMLTAIKLNDSWRIVNFFVQ